MPNIAGQYTRHSVEKDIRKFEGWTVLLDRYAKIKSKEEWDVSQVYSGSFLTGGRVNEVLRLKASMFTPKVEIITTTDGRQIARDVLEVEDMPLEKRYTKKSHYIERLTEEELPKSVIRRLFPSEPNADGFYERKRFVTVRKVDEVRQTFEIPMDEVKPDWRIMHYDFAKYLKELQDSEWLYPSHTKNTRMSDSFIWKIFHAYGIYPHYLRGQRASCLITHNGLKMEQMMEWMSWEELKTARHYGKMGKVELLTVFKRFE